MMSERIEMKAEHLTEWSKGSGIDAIIIEANVRSYNSRKEISELLGWNVKCESGWFVRGIDPVTGNLRKFGQFKPDSPVYMEGKRVKYLTPKGLKSEGIFLLNPKEPNFWLNVKNSNEPIYITEGAKKAAALLQHRKAAMALTGVWNGLKNREVLIEDLLLFAQPSRQVFICFDSDQVTNPNIRMAISRLKKCLEDHKCKVFNIVLPVDTKGIDDYLLRKSLADFEALCLPNNQAANKKSRSLPEALIVAKGIAETQRDKVLFELAGSQWYLFSQQQEGIWSAVTSIKVQYFVIQYIDSTYREATYSFSYISNVLNFMKPLLMIDELVQPERTVPFHNGLYFLDTNEFKALEPKYYCTFSLPFDYNPQATCAKIDSFLNQCVSPYADMAQVLYGIAGLAVTRNTSYQLFFEMFGPGGSGKSTFINLVIAILGKSNVLVTDLRTLENSRFEAASVKGKCAIVITEGERFSEKSTMLKRIVGNDLIRFEKKYEQPGVGFYCRAVVLIATNELIIHSDTTSGLFRRRVIIPFQNKIAVSERKNLLSFKPDGTLEGDLVEELPGFVNKVIQTLQPSNFARLNSVFHNPLLLSGATQGVLGSIGDNSVFSYIKDNIIFNPEFQIQLGLKNSNPPYNCGYGADEALYKRYCDFCDSQALHAMALNRFSNAFLDICVNQLNLTFVYRFRKTVGTFFKGAYFFNYEGCPFVISEVPEISGRPSALLERVVFTAIRPFTMRLSFSKPIDFALESRLEVWRIRQSNESM
jgi:putative DNA primase/helicase